MKHYAEQAAMLFCRIYRQLRGAGVSGSWLSVFYPFSRMDSADIPKNIPACIVYDLVLFFVLTVMCMISIWITWRFFTGRKRNLRYGIAAGVCFLVGAAACAGALNMPVLQEENGTAWGLEQLDGEWIRGSGIIEQVSEKEGTVTLLIKDVRLLSPCQGQLGKSLHLICEQGMKEPGFPGQAVGFSGIFSRYGAAANPGAFDYRDYCWSLGIAGQVETTNDQMQIGGSSPLIRAYLWKFRNFIRQRVLQMAQPEDAGILVCLLTGDKTQLNTYWKELYQDGGIIHLLTISGLHISILGMGAFHLLRKLMGSFFWSSLLSGILAGAFCVMAGAGTSMVRAVICFFLYLLAGYVGKTYDFLTAAAVSGLMILLEYPLLLFQSGFLMTFSCVLGIGTLLPLGEFIFVAENEGNGQNRLMGKLQKTLLAAVFLQLSSLPAVLWFQGKVSLAGPVINLVTVPFMGLVLISGMLAVAGSLLTMPLGIFLLGAAHYILRWYEQVCLFFNRLSGLNLVTGRPHGWQMILWFTLLAAVLSMGFCLAVSHPVMEPWRNRWRNGWGNQWISDQPVQKVSEHGKLPFVMGLLLFPCAVFMLHRFPDSRLIISFLDVGQGDGIVLELPGGEGVFCIDGGSSSQKKLDEYVYEPYFAYEGIDSVDCWLLTHPDSDHYSGMIAMLEKGFPVKRIMMPEVFRDSELAQRLEALHPVDYIQAGSRLEAGEIWIEILHPSSDYSSQDENDASAVVYLEWKNFSALFTGDMALESEDEVIEALRGRRVNVLKVAHHGSKTATSEEFLKMLSARTAILSCGQNNRYGHPHREVLERLEQAGITYWKTTESGCIQVFCDGERYKVETFLQNMEV